MQIQRFFKSHVLVACCVSFAAAHAIAQTSVSSHYQFVTLDYPGQPITYPLGINNKQQIAGYYLDASDVPHGFVYKRGIFTAVVFPGAAVTTAASINDHGDVAGVYLDQEGFQHGYLMKVPDGCDADRDYGFFHCQPVFLSIDFPGAAQTTGIDFEFGTGLGTASPGLNDRDELVGMYATQGSYSDGFIYSRGEYRSVDDPAATHTAGNGTRLFGINNLGAVVGDYIVQSDPSALPVDYGFLLEGGHFTKIFVPASDQGGYGTQVNGINDFNTLVGVFSDPTGGVHGLLWVHGQYFSLDYPQALFTEAHVINDRGDITGSYTSDPTGATVHGFLAHLKF